MIHSRDHTLAPTHSSVLEPSVYRWKWSRWPTRISLNLWWTSASGTIFLGPGSHRSTRTKLGLNHSAIFDFTKLSTSERSIPTRSHRVETLVARGPLPDWRATIRWDITTPWQGWLFSLATRTASRSVSWWRLSWRGGIPASTSMRPTRVGRRAPRHTLKHLRRLEQDRATRQKHRTPEICVQSFATLKLR